MPASVPRGPTETQWSDPDYVEPLKTIYTVPTGHDFKDTGCGEEFDLCWPSIAPASLEYVPSDHAPNPMLADGLLVPGLKTGSLFVFKLSGDANYVPITALR